MSTNKTTRSRARASANGGGGAAGALALPRRTWLVQLGAAVAMRETVLAATRPLGSPGDARTRLSELGKRAGDGVKRLEQRGERANSELNRQVKRAVSQLRRQGG